MNKNKILLSLLLLTFIYLVIRQINFSVVEALTEAQCVSGGGVTRVWHCYDYRENCLIEPGVPCTQWETSTYTQNYCCPGATDECGGCTNYCTRERERRVCVDPNARPPKYEPCGPEKTICHCSIDGPDPTPCQPCLTNAPQQAAKSCQCLELTPKKTSQELSFTCLVQVPTGASITDYTVTFKKPNGGLINLKSKNITKVQDGSNNYQVETTAITATEKGKYEMVVPPLIICQ